MKNYDYNCAEDGHGLRYPEFSVVLLQIFALGSIKEFRFPEELSRTGFMESNNNGIDSQIFTMSRSEEKRNIRRFSLGGFDFNLPLKLKNACHPVVLWGHVAVEMSLLFGHTVSIAYYFVFDKEGKGCKASEPVSTDHIIALLASHMSAEHWSKNKGKSETDINMEITDFVIRNLHLDENGVYRSKPVPEIKIDGCGRVFDNISGRYKKFILDSCTVERSNVSAEEKRLYRKYNSSSLDGSCDDFHYAMVDIWESVQHPLPIIGKNCDLFSKDRTDRLSEAGIINHIRDFHKPELIGLMTLYPGEWPYRDSEAYDDVCGKNIAIDTDDLVLVNDNVCVVIGTYGRRGADSPVDWEEHLQERDKYHVSWPEYLMILEMVLAKKYVIEYASDQLIDATLGVDNVSSSDIIAHNAELSMRLSRMELQLDVVKYSKFMSHKVMFDRTTERLGLEKATERLNSMMDVVDNSLHNLSDYKAMKSDFTLNIILVLISIASVFELFFQNSRMPFLAHFGFETEPFAVTLVCVVAGLTIFGLLLVVANAVKSIFKKIKLLWNNLRFWRRFRRMRKA